MGAEKSPAAPTSSATAVIGEFVGVCVADCVADADAELVTDTDMVTDNV